MDDHQPTAQMPQPMGTDFLVELKGVCLSAAECLDRPLLEDGDEDFFLPRRLPGEVSLPKAAAAEATLRRVVIANERRMLRCLMLEFCQLLLMSVIYLVG